MKNGGNTVLAHYRLEKALHNLIAARDAFFVGNYDIAVGRSYYAIFNAMRSLLATKRIDSKKHSGVIALFNQNFIKENLLPKGFYKVISEAKKLRELAEYGDFVNVSKTTAKTHIDNAENFLREVDKVLRKVLFESIKT